jgi:hypothetical protein
LYVIGPAAIADAIRNMGALSSANVLSNFIPVEQAQELVKIMRSKDTLTTLCGLTGVETELDFSSQGLGAGDAVLIANDISDMRALAVLNVSNNRLGDIVLVDGIKHCKATSGEMLYWDKDDTCLGEEVPPGCGPLGIIALANAIPDMRAISTVIVNAFPLPIQDIKSKAELDFSGKGLQ